MIKLTEQPIIEEQVEKEEKEDFNAGRHVSSPTMVFVMVSGMVGTSCMVIPIVDLTTGWLTTIWVNIVVAFFLYYTASLIITHLGIGKGMRDSILAHFNNNYKYLSAYGIIIWFSFVPFIFLSTRIICLELQQYFGWNSWELGIIFSLSMIAITILARITHFAQETMAFGLVAFFSYLIFLIWAQITAPSGPHTVPATGSPAILAAALISNLEIHDFLAQNILKVKEKDQYQSVVKYSFIFGPAIFFFCSLGSFAIVNRNPYIANPQLITDYFPSRSWYVIIVNLAFMIVGLVTIPNFLNVSMIRFFQIFKVRLDAKISMKEVIYYVFMIVASTVVYILGANFQLLYSLNGSVIAFSYVLVIPVWIHLKCVWFDRSSGTIKGDDEWNSQIVPNKCLCQRQYSSKWSLYAETVFLIFLVVSGFVLMLLNLLSIGKTASGSS